MLGCFFYTWLPRCVLISWMIVIGLYDQIELFDSLCNWTEWYIPWWACMIHSLRNWYYTADRTGFPCKKWQQISVAILLLPKDVSLVVSLSAEATLPCDAGCVWANRAGRVWANLFFVAARGLTSGEVKGGAHVSSCGLLRGTVCSLLSPRRRRSAPSHPPIPPFPPIDQTSPSHLRRASVHSSTRRGRRRRTLFMRSSSGRDRPFPTPGRTSSKLPSFPASVGWRDARPQYTRCPRGGTPRSTSQRPARTATSGGYCRLIYYCQEPDLGQIVDVPGIWGDLVLC
jgi:hypothetical protein